MINLAIRAVFLALVSMVSTFSIAQINDPPGISYTSVLDNNNVSFSKIKVKMGFPITLKNENQKIINSFAYENVSIDFNRDYGIDKSEIDQFHSISYGLGYTSPLRNDWSYFTMGSFIINSNFTGSLMVDDLFYSVLFAFKKEYGTRESPRNLLLGTFYNQAIGVNFPLPVIRYEHKFHPKFFYSVGIPSCDLFYYPNEKLTLSLNAYLDGFTGNIQNNLAVDGEIADKAVSNVITTGITIDYRFIGIVSAYATGGFTPLYNTQLLDGRFNEVLNFDSGLSPFFGFGLRLSFDQD